MPDENAHPSGDTSSGAPEPAPAAKSAADLAAEQALRAAQEAVASLSSDLGAESTDAAATAAAPTGSPRTIGGDQPPSGQRPEQIDLPAFATPDATGAAGPIDLLSDVNLNVKIELGRTRMLVEDVLRLADGAVIELDKLAGDPVDIYVNDRHVARGEVLVLNDNFCVRINEILKSGSEARIAG